ncbi:MAG: hypothetical protein Q8K99_13555 [Actinomycetota bacterium]|nr:hypothetical protein [Actinomycetota bacterium]
MQVHRLQSPFKHWLGGLAIELVAFAGFFLAVAVLVAVLVRIL